MLPAPAAEIAKPAQPIEVEVASAKMETTPVKAFEPPPLMVSVPVSAPGSKTGTLELTATEAEAMGVRPGFTPGALFMPPR